MKKIKINSSISFERKIDSYMWNELTYRHDDFEYKYEDMKLLAVRCKDVHSKEYKRDFSFLSNKRYTVYVEHIETKKVFCITYYYRATFKSDGYDILNVETSSHEEIKKLKDRHRERALFKIDEFNSKYKFDMFIVEACENEEREGVTYSYFLDWFEEEEEDEDIE